jgi:DNA invertase Pin-like site-specific DNA recombinase
MTTRAAIYRRVSTAGQEDGASLPVQERECQIYVAEQGYELVGVYTDVHSGIDLWHREQLQETLRDAEQGKFDVLVVHHTDRLSRDPDHQAFIRVVLRQQGVAVESVTNPRTDSFEDRIRATFEDLFAQYEHGRIRARMESGRRHRVEVEKRLQPGGWPLFGYAYDDPAKSEKNAYVENRAESWVVRRIYRECVEGKSLRQIAAGLNADGILTGRGKTWGPRQISRLLAHPTYRGYTAANRYTSYVDENGKRQTAERPESEWLPTPNVAPALVDEETWLRANERLQRNRRERTRPYDAATDALLRAGFVTCKWCGGPMSVHRQHGRIYYRCNNAQRDPSAPCRGKCIEATKLDAFVWNLCESWITDPGVLLHEARREGSPAHPDGGEDLSAYDLGLQQIEAEQSRLAQRLGLLDDTAAQPVLNRLNELGQQHAALVAEREEAAQRFEAAQEQERVIASIWDEINAYVERVSEWGYEQKRELLHRLGVRVTVEKQGVGQARFWVDVSPPWPEGTAWWDNLFGRVPGGPFAWAGPEPAVTSVGALVLAAIGSKTASQMSGRMSCASLATSSRSAVWPRAFAPGAAETNVTRASPMAIDASLALASPASRGCDCRRRQRRSRLMRAWGRWVGAATTMLPPDRE